MGYERNDRRYGYGSESGRSYGRDPRNERDYGDPRDRGFFDRAGDEVRSWFGDEEAERRRRADEQYDERYDQERGRYESRDRYADDGRSGSGYRYGPRSWTRDTEDYPRWSRSNRDDSRYSSGYAPTSQHYQRTGENRGFGDDSYGGGRSYADTGYGYGAGGDRARQDAEYRAYYRGGARGGSSDQRNEDPHGYHSWRERQIASFDRDYDEYRRENQSRFESEFSTWRQTRQTQRTSLGQVKEHQEVVGSDGTHVGKVDHVRGDRILLTKTDRDAGGHHHSIPSSWIRTVDDKVHLAKTAAEAQQAWRDEENNQGLFGRSQDDGNTSNTGNKNDGDATNLNRSFSGTY